MENNRCLNSVTDIDISININIALFSILVHVLQNKRDKFYISYTRLLFTTEWNQVEMLIGEG